MSKHNTADRRTMARLAAVQYIYAVTISGNKEQGIQKAMIDDENQVFYRMDKDLFNLIIAKFLEEKDRLDAENNKIEPLIKAIVSAATLERSIIKKGLDALIISEYLKITESFYDTSQVKLVHGILSQAFKETETE